MTIKLRILAGGTMLFALSACTPVNHSFGEAVAWNKAIQTVNPDPDYSADDAQPGDNAEVAVDAAEAYRQGSVERPAAPSTQVGSGGGGGGGGPR